MIARADRLAGGEIAFDDLPENLARALVELREADLRRADRDVVDETGPSGSQTLFIQLAVDSKFAPVRRA